MDYTVELETFRGPLDLLLFLVKRHEVDICDIPIARVAEQFLEYLKLLELIDVEWAGEFLVMAATLMEIKSATLLPPAAPVVSADGEPTAAQQLADPRFELVQKLLEYKKFKDAANALDAQHRQHADRFPRYPALLDGDADEPPPVDLEEVQVWDLLSAFDRLMKEVGVRKPKYHEVTYDDTPIDLHAADIEDQLKRDGKLTLRSLVAGRKSRSEMIGVFLALLELIREKKILVSQTDPLGEVEIEIAPEEHRKTYIGASLHLSDENPAGENAEESDPE